MSGSRWLPRSYLYVPATRPDRLTKAWTSGADAVIVDLEDAVPPARKQEARTTTRMWLQSLRRASAGSRRPELWVRINRGPVGRDDVAALKDSSMIDGLVVAKASVAWMKQVATDLDRRGLDLMLSPLLETAEAVLDVRRIAALRRVRRLQIGEYDLCGDTGIRPSRDDEEMASIRTLVVLASAERGLDPPVAPVSVETLNLPQFERSTRTAARQGFLGRACIHPRQLDIVHAVFTPSPDAIASANRLIDAYEKAVSSGAGAFVDGEGRMVDEATVRIARRTLSIGDLPVLDRAER